jgi:HPt (histidine-containing phosphotransfer) domain-containing protein
MAKLRVDKPSVSTFADHEVILPVHKLHKAIKVTGGGEIAIDEEAIARAEAALAELTPEFDTWMRTECERLDAARNQIKTTGLKGKAFDELFRAAHDIKGESATFGYPLAADAADSLCRLLEHTPDAARIPLELVDQHVDGIRAIIREDVRETSNALGSALATGLRQVTDDFLIQANRHRPEYLEGIITFAPPLVPGR